MTVGNVTGTQPGEGARFNEGKPPVRFIPWYVLNQWATSKHCAPKRDIGSLELRLILASAALSDWEFRRCNASSALSFAHYDDLAQAAAQLEFGARKYDDWNWALGMKWSVPSECAKRHFIKAILDVCAVDDESGVSHAGAFWCNVVMLSHLQRHYADGDDRPGADGKTLPYLSISRI